MKIRRTTMAIAAAGALALTACTSDSGGGGGTGGGEGTGGGGSDPADSSASESAAPGAAGGTAKPDLGEITTKDDTITLSVGEEEWESFNGLQADANSTYNAIVNDRLQSSFVYFGTDGTIYPNEEFGSYEVTSEDPLTVEYTISDEAVWEDGTPITINDYLLDWASSNPETLFPDGDGKFERVSDTFGKFVPEGPEGEVDSKTFTVTYPEPYPDWQLVVEPPMPAHVAARETGLEPAALAQAILDRDASDMADVAEFWNTGWVFADKKLPDPALVPSSGPYSLKGATWNSPEFLTLVPNENWWGTPPATANLTYRFADPATLPQALQNGDVDIIEPQASVDTVQQIEAMGEGFELLRGEELTWEHLDFNFRDSSAFSEAEGGLAAREAFAMCVPRQEIVTNIIQPINPDSVVMNAREIFPFQEGYDELVSEVYDGRYDEVDLEGAKAKLEESGLSTPVKVRIAYSAPNPRRTEQVSAIKSSCDQAGFEITDTGTAEMFNPGGPLDTGDYEVALFAWAGSGQIASGQAIYSTAKGEEGQNFGKYSNPEVDKAWQTLATSNDEAVWDEQRVIIEKLLWDDLFGIPLFAHPGVVGYDATIDNVIQNGSQTGIAWNAEQWVRAE